MIKNFQGFIFLLFVISIFSCVDPKTNVPASLANEESISRQSINDANFLVQDSSLYTRSFLDSLKNSGYAKTYSLNGRTLVLDQIDTVLIPNDLEIGMTAEFVGANNGRHYFLMLKQLNYTTIHFGLAIYENKELIDKQVGNVNLSPLFFLGAETDEDDSSGISYPSTEYINTNNECEIAIRLGKNETNELLVKISRACSDSVRNINLDQSPTFRRTKTPTN